MQHMNSNHHNSQVSEAYSMKASNQAPAAKKHNSSFNQSKYLSNHSPSPSQTFFKDSKKGQSLIGKKVLPPFGKKTNKIYVSYIVNPSLIPSFIETLRTQILPHSLLNHSATRQLGEIICKRSRQKWLIFIFTLILLQHHHILKFY